MRPSARELSLLTEALGRYAARLHQAEGGGHSVTSALGVWLLLAQASDTVAEADRREVERTLGMPVHTAKSLAGALLDAPHPKVASATAVWTRRSHETSDLRAWLEGLPERLTRGPVPTQAEADRWAAANTEGLIDRFPIAIDEDTLLVLASAVATKVDWWTPFQVAAVESTPVGASWPSGVTAVLRSPAHVHRYISFADASGIGDAAVHEAAADGLLVVSVRAGRDVPQARVLEAAHRIAVAAAAPWEPSAERRSLFDLELGAQECWHLSEAAGPVTSPSGREERVEAYLPAWTADTDLDLTADPGLGVGPALSGLAGLLRPDARGFLWQARQTGTASYSATGFAAAAVTAFAVRAGGLPAAPRPGIIRTATLLFDGPHAVVAVALDPPDGLWHGLPVFSAWVTEAVEP